jgi:phytoene synthase
MNPRLLALQHTVHRYGIPKRYFLDLLEGVEMDRTKHRYSTFDELDVYCFRVASVVGLIMTHIFGVSDPEGFVHAAELGTAMQLTNILRDVGEDLRMGRIYLPMDELLETGLTEADLQKGEVTPRMREFLQYQIARARHYYARAEQGVSMLTDDGSRFCVRLMLETYSGILADIEASGYNVFTRRAYVPLRRKVALAVRYGFFPPRNGRPLHKAPESSGAAVPVLRAVPSMQRSSVSREQL